MVRAEPLDALVVYLETILGVHGRGRLACNGLGVCGHLLEHCLEAPGVMFSRRRHSSSPRFQTVCHSPRGFSTKSPGPASRTSSPNCAPKRLRNRRLQSSTCRAGSTAIGSGDDTSGADHDSRGSARRLGYRELALRNHAQMVAESQTSRAAIYDPMRIEADARPRRVQVPHVSCSTLV